MLASHSLRNSNASWGCHRRSCFAAHHSTLASIDRRCRTPRILCCMHPGAETRTELGEHIKHTRGYTTTQETFVLRIRAMLVGFSRERLGTPPTCDVSYLQNHTITVEDKSPRGGHAGSPPACPYSYGSMCCPLERRCGTKCGNWQEAPTELRMASQQQRSCTGNARRHGRC